MVNDNDWLGYVGEDKVTGFRGRITAIVRYISGCTQVCLSPKVKDDDVKLPDGSFFDIQRIMVDMSEPRLFLDNRVPGHDALPKERRVIRGEGLPRTGPL
jgi:hypothetical protein